MADRPEVRVRGDEGLLRLALENLVRNAWKFSKRRAPAQIAFGSLGEGENSILFLRDNGAGFDMTKAQKLFGAFQRLHQQRDYEGTGIGLTIVKRIVERHGGRIWVRPRPSWAPPSSSPSVPKPPSRACLSRCG